MYINVIEYVNDSYEKPINENKFPAFVIFPNCISVQPQYQAFHNTNRPTCDSINHIEHS
jgi:hypothetical protein